MHRVGSKGALEMRSNKLIIDLSGTPHGEMTFAQKLE